VPGRLTRRDGRALLVAEAPCRGARPGHRALDGPAGDRLGRYFGEAVVAERRAAGDAWPLIVYRDRDLLLERFDTVNLLGRWPGGEGKGAAWPRDAARRAARRLPLRGVVVLLGLRVLDAYRGRHPQLWGVPWGEWRELRAGHGPEWDPSRWTTVAVLPHPSGIVRNYNDPAARELAGRTLLEAERLAREVAA
jgi:uracil-DNA glycosylase